MSIVQVRVKHGSVKTPTRAYVAGEVFEMSEADAMSMDPSGVVLEILKAAPVVAAPLPAPPPPPPPVVEAAPLPPPPAPKKRKKGLFP